MRRQFLEACLKRAFGHGEEPHGTGVDDGEARSGHHEARGYAEGAAKAGIDPIVECCQRKEHADGQNRAGHAIAEGGEAAGCVGEARTSGARRIGKHEAEQDRDQSGGAGNQDAMEQRV
ncbi:hypothetical protein D3C72_1726060 [compost metagenome]